MGKFYSKLKFFLLNPFNIKMFFITMPLLLEISVAMPIFNTYLKVGLIWAAGYLFYDIFKQRNIFKIEYSKLLFAFVFTYMITILLNRNIQLKMNLIGYFYIIVNFFVLLIPSDKKNTRKEIKKLNGLILKITAVASTIGIFLFLVQFLGEFSYNDGLYRVGFYANRLVGVYRGVTTPTTAIGIMVAIIQLTILYQDKTKGYSLPIYALMINFIHTGLSNSKGIYIGMYVFVAVFMFFVIYGYLSKKQVFMRVVTGIVVVAISIFIFSSLMQVTRKSFSYIPAELNQIYHLREEGDDNFISEPIDLDREISGDYDVFTGRPHIWKLGLERFTMKPVFGYGAFTTAKTISLPFSSQSFSTYHNFYIHTLVSAGLLGFITLMTFLILKVYNVLTYLFKNDLSSKNYTLIASIAALLAFYAVTNAGETTIMYMNKFSEFTFWIYLGYLTSLISNENESNEDSKIYLA